MGDSKGRFHIIILFEKDFSGVLLIHYDCASSALAGTVLTFTSPVSVTAAPCRKCCPCNSVCINITLTFAAFVYDNNFAATGWRSVTY